MVLGLSEIDAKKLLAQHGENRFVTAPKPDVVEIFRSSFSLQMILLLVAIGFLATVNAEVALTAFAFVIAIAALETYRDIRVQRSISAVQTAYVGETTVIREGLRKRIPTTDIVPGDIVVLMRGDRIPADGTAIDGECSVDESAFGRGTLDKRPISESERSEIVAFGKTDPSVLLAGTFVAEAPEGGCTMLIEKTGTGTKISRAVTPLPRRLSALERIEKVMAAVNPIVLLFGVLVFAVVLFFGAGLLDAFAIAAAVAVAGMPQYIFSTAQAAFFLTLERISRRTAVRRADIIENLAGTTLIVTEKMRALTLGEYTVGKLWIDGVDVEVTGEGWTTEGDFKGLASFGTLDLMTRTVAAATEAVPMYEGDRLKVAGRPDEEALVVLAMKNMQPVQSIRSEYPVLGRTTADDGTTSVILRTPQRTRQSVLIGPVDAVARRCSSIMIDGKPVKADRDRRNEIERKAIEMAADGFNVVAVASFEKAEKAAAKAKRGRGQEGGKEGMTLLCLAGIYDPPRKDIKEIVGQCREAGIDVIVLTEESETTAIQFARQLGILEKGKRAIIADELKYMKPAERSETVARTVVFARASPEEEAAIINELKGMGQKVMFIESVGRDPAAMAAADTAIAMDSSPDILKFNAAGILKNDDFYGALAAIEESKAFSLNVERLFYTIFTLDFAILFFVLLSAVWMGGQTLTLLQILLVNAIADSLGGIGLARERVPESALMDPKKERKFPSGREFTFAFALSVYIAAATLVVASAFPQHYLSVAFATLVLSFAAVTLNFTTLRLPVVRAIGTMVKEPKKPVITAAAVSIIVLLAVLYTPLNSLFGTTPLAPAELAAALAAALSIFVVVEIKKAVLR